MTTEKLQELMQARMAYFGEHLSDERVTAQLKAYAANLGTVPDDIAEQAFLIALANGYTVTTTTTGAKVDTPPMWLSQGKDKDAELKRAFGLNN